MIRPPSPIVSILQELQETVLSIEGNARQQTAILPFGVDALDHQLAGRGLQLNALHEITGRSAGWADDAAALLFISSIAARIKGSVLWVLRSHDLFAPGLYQAGLNPDRVIYAEARSDVELLAIMEEGLRHGGLGIVVGEVRRISTAATRRLQLASRDGKTLALLLKRPAKKDENLFSMPSAAISRWKVSHAPSAPVPWGGLGPARWHLTCIRQRGGNPFELIVEAPDETGRIALPAELVDRSVTPGRVSTRTVAA